MARIVCLQLLTAAPRTRAQLAEALAKRGVPDEPAQRVLTRLGEVGLIDDAAFARAWVNSRHAGRGLAGRALAQELRRRGVEPETAAAALDELDPDTERATARTLVRRRARSLAGLAPEVKARRLIGMLARKGYSSGVALAVVRDELAATGPALEDVPD